MAENKGLYKDLLDVFPEDRTLKFLSDLQAIQESLHMIHDNLSLLQEEPEQFAKVHQDLVKHYDELVAQYEDVVVKAELFHHVVIYSAKPLSDSMKEKILAQVEEHWGSKYIVDYRIDPSLLGGIRLEVDDSVFDATYRSRLDQLAREV